MLTKQQRAGREFELEGIVPWGRRYSEYEAFFGLAGGLPSGRVLDAGGGPSSFAAEAHARGIDVVAADPLYGFSGGEIERQVKRTADAMRARLRRAAYRFNWNHYGSEETLFRLRHEALALFLADYEEGRREGRYVACGLPSLPFTDGSFRLALVSHLLFLYGDTLDFQFHLTAMRELLRVAGEVRIFPLINLDGLPSSHLPRVVKSLRAEGAEVEIVEVPFEFQRGARCMLRVR